MAATSNPPSKCPSCGHTRMVQHEAKKDSQGRVITWVYKCTKCGEKVTG